MPLQQKKIRDAFWEDSSFYRSGAWKRLAKLALNIVRIVLLLAILTYIVPLALRVFPATAKLATRNPSTFAVSHRRLLGLVGRISK